MGYLILNFFFHQIKNPQVPLNHKQNISNHNHDNKCILFVISPTLLIKYLIPTAYNV